MLFESRMIRWRNFLDSKRTKSWHHQRSKHLPLFLVWKQFLWDGICLLFWIQLLSDKCSRRQLLTLLTCPVLHESCWRYEPPFTFSPGRKLSCKTLWRNNYGSWLEFGRISPSTKMTWWVPSIEPDNNKKERENTGYILSLRWKMCRAMARATGAVSL